ncbi:unnamed protein product [Tuber aestivum]|uniref:Uncharacterized protein n=1 Tax=Tuber aestivum TaxID=59557 RepID=A0A292PKN6_9PEZI|nr:unnamed protein product [Tuber aestivum]
MTIPLCRRVCYVPYFPQNTPLPEHLYHTFESPLTGCTVLAQYSRSLEGYDTDQRDTVMDCPDEYHNQEFSLGITAKSWMNSQSIHSNLLASREYVPMVIVHTVRYSTIIIQV